MCSQQLKQSQHTSHNRAKAGRCEGSVTHFYRLQSKQRNQAFFRKKQQNSAYLHQWYLWKERRRLSVNEDIRKARQNQLAHHSNKSLKHVVTKKWKITYPGGGRGGNRKRRSCCSYTSCLHASCLHTSSLHSCSLLVCSSRATGCCSPSCHHNAGCCLYARGHHTSCRHHASATCRMYGCGTGGNNCCGTSSNNCCGTGSHNTGGECNTAISTRIPAAEQRRQKKREVEQQSRMTVVNKGCEKTKCQVSMYFVQLQVSGPAQKPFAPHPPVHQ